MNTYKHENILFIIEEDITVGEYLGDVEESLGYCTYDISKKLIKEFRKSDDFGGCGRIDKGFENNNADFFISFINWYANTGKEDIQITVTTQHPFWFYHDLMHIEGKNVLGCEGNINAHLERYRLQEGLELWLKETSGKMEFEYRGYVEKSFYNRFKERIEISFFRDWEEDMYAEWANEDEYIEEEQLDEDKY